jgi:hypothetical protein
MSDPVATTFCKDEEAEGSWRWCRSNSGSGGGYEIEEDERLKAIRG